MSVFELVYLCVQLIILLSAFGFFFLSLLLLVECIAALFPVPSSDYRDGEQFTKMAILMPAHNEELVIKDTLSILIPTLKTHHQTVVIADNCNDRTAEMARSAGAIVIERQDPNLKGKGYALDYGLQFIASDPPEVVVFIDADCQVDNNTIPLLTQQAIATGKPVQATYLMAKPNHPSPKDSISAFAFKVKNLVRSRGMVRLGLPCLLAGTGMAFPWSVIRSINIANSEIVEDMKLGLDLSILGYSPIFCPNALVTGNLPQNTEAAKSQRTRWEHGHLQTLLTYVPKLLIAGVSQRRLELIFSALDLCIPPLSLFVIMWFGMMLISLLVSSVSVAWIPLGVTTLSGFMIVSAIMISWSKFARSDLPFKELVAVPIYILWKIPLYFKFLIQPQKTWIRTERD